MRIRAKVSDLTPALGRVERRVTRATANAINRTLEEAQARTRGLLHQRLTIRSAGTAQYLERLVRFDRFDRATPANLSARFGLQDAGTGTKRKSAQLLIKLTRGGIDTRPASNPFFIPTSQLRPRPTSRIPRALYPSALRLVTTRFTIPNPTKQARRGSRGGILVRGKRRAYAIDPEFHAPRDPSTLGVWQRTGKGASSAPRMLWAYRQQRRLPKRYPFTETALHVVRERWPVNLTGFLESEARRASRP
jgi:hypothetical protein